MFFLLHYFFLSIFLNSSSVFYSLFLHMFFFLHLTFVLISGLPFLSFLLFIFWPIPFSSFPSPCTVYAQFQMTLYHEIEDVGKKHSWKYNFISTEPVVINSLPCRIRGTSNSYGFINKVHKLTKKFLWYPFLSHYTTHSATLVL